MKLTRKGTVSLALCLMMLMAVAAPALAANIAGYGTIGSAGATVYSTASKAAVLGTFAKDDVVGIEASSGSMYKVRLSGSSTSTGYVEKSAFSGAIRASIPSGKSHATMTAAAGSSSTGGTNGVIANCKSAVNFRSGASTSSKKIGTLKLGTAVTVLGEQSGFYNITANGQTGYVSKAYVSVTSSSSSSSSSSGATNTAGGTSTGSISTVVGDVSVLPGSSSPLSAVSTAMAAAEKKNSDTLGYIKIAGTNIDFPILNSTKDPFYYLTYDINKKKTTAAAVNSLYNVLVRNNTVTAHNMRGSNNMFHQLHHLQEKALGNSTCAHSKCVSKSLSSYPNIATDASARVWDITLFGYNKWEVWAMYEVKANEPKSTINTNVNTLNSYSVAQRQAWIKNQQDRSQIKFGTSVTANDILLTIYTCGDNYDSSTAQSRLYFFLKAVR